MRARIKTIHPPSPSRSGRGAYRFHRVDFILEDGRFCVTDLCPEFGNFRRSGWSEVLRIGNTLEIEEAAISRDGRGTWHLNADYPVRLASLPFAAAEKVIA